jgi:osmotically inducible protein OsmC
MNLLDSELHYYSTIQGDETMPTRRANATWEGDLKSGKGTMALGSGAYEGPFSFATRFEEEPGTNPEELIGAAHAGCFSMAFSADLGRAGFTPEHVATSAKVHLGIVDGAAAITHIELTMEAKVPGIDEAKFQEIANGTKTGCPVSKALAAVDISLNATLLT